MSQYFFNIDENNIVVDSALAGEFTGQGWIYSGNNLISPGMYYNAEIKKCYWLCRFPSWILDPDTGHFNAPIPKPQDDNNYFWDEPTQSWVIMTDVSFKLPYEMFKPVYDIP